MYLLLFSDTWYFTYPNSLTTHIKGILERTLQYHSKLLLTEQNELKNYNTKCTFLFFINVEL